MLSLSGMKSGMMISFVLLVRVATVVSFLVLSRLAEI